MSHTYAIVITFIIFWAPTMEGALQDQGHTLTQHDTKVLELMCKVPSLLGLRSVSKLEIRFQNLTTSEEVPLVALIFDNKTFPGVSLDPLARVKGQMDSKDPSKCSLQVIQPLRSGVYRCSIHYDDGSPNVKSFQVNVDESHEQPNNSSFMVTVLPAIILNATWVQALTSKLYEISFTQFTVEAEKPVKETILYVSNTIERLYESKLVFLSSFSERVHAGQENRFEVILYLKSDATKTYSVSVSNSEGLHCIPDMGKTQWDKVMIGLIAILIIVSVLCLIFVFLYIWPLISKSSKCSKTSCCLITQSSSKLSKETKTPSSLPEGNKTSSSLLEETHTDQMESERSQSNSTHNFGNTQPENPHASSTASTRNKPNSLPDDRSGISETVELKLHELGIKPSELDSGDENEELLGRLKVMGDPDSSITLHKQNRQPKYEQSTV